MRVTMLRHWLTIWQPPLHKQREGEHQLANPLRKLLHFNKLRDYNATHIGEAIPSLQGVHENELFYNCTVNKTAHATLKDCVMIGSKFPIDDLRDMLPMTVTLDCFTFGNVELSETMFDAFLLLLCKTKGNTEKRSKLIGIIGRERAYELLKKMETLE